MKRTLTWDDITDFYRKKPARFKAMQYVKGMELLPPDVSYMTNPDDNQKVLVVCHSRDKTTLIEENDWLVLDIETDKTHVMKEDIFNLVFEMV